jgi:heptosyltransferase-3
MGLTRSRGKILVIRGGAIGDFILTLPAIAALRSRFPEAHLEVLGYPHIVQLALAAGLVDRVQSIEARALAGFFARNGELDPALTDYFSEFDLMISYLYDPDEVFKTNVGLCSAGQFIAGAHRPDEREKFHATRVFLKPLERLAVFDADPVPRLFLNPQPPAGPKAGAGGPARNELALHPGSGSERKNWPENRWAQLLQYLLNTTRWDLLLIGGEAEGERLQRLAAALPSDRVRVAQSLPLPELGRRLLQCSGFIGHDSGISHLAAALGLPGLVLWGDSAEEIWRPPQPNVVVLKGRGGLEGMSVEEVIRDLAPLLERTAGTGSAGIE